MWVLEFFDVTTGANVGTVRFDGERLFADSSVVSLVDGLAPEDVLAKYQGWSNGYVAARLEGTKRPKPQGAMKMRPAAETDALVKDHVETTHFFDDTAGELYEPVSVPDDPSPDDDE
jgi:hypothetical protein